MASRKTFGPIGSSNHVISDRELNDYYATPPEVVEQLLKVENFRKTILEPCVGEGHIANVLTKHKHKVVAADIVDRGYHGTHVKDFLTTQFKTNLNVDIVTNPPYKHAQAFVEKSLEIINDGNKVAMFLKTLFLESQSRYKLFKENPPKYIYVFSKRRLCAINGEFERFKSAPISYSWFVWEKGYQGETIVRWIL